MACVRCRISSAALSATLIAIVMSVFGCAAPRGEAELLAVLLERGGPMPWREAAARQLGSIGTVTDSQAYRQALHRLAWSDAEPLSLRLLAIDRLIEDDPLAFRQAADAQIVHVREWPVLEHVFEYARRERWEDFAWTAIRSLARPSGDYSDRDRPEWALIEALRPGAAVEDVLGGVVLGVEDGAGLRHQVDAWVVLVRVWPVERQREWLTGVHARSLLAGDLQAAASVVDELPSTQQQLAWLMHVRAVDGGIFWSRAAERAAMLDAEQRRGLTLRHLPMLVQMDAGQLAVSRAELWRHVSAALADRAVVVRTDRVPAGWSESLADHEMKLAWGDLLTIRLLLDALAQPGMVEALFAQAEADRADTGSEHGGVLHWGDGGGGVVVVAQSFPPELRIHGRQFVASHALIERMYIGLAHYHFHAQAYGNAAYAGPGGGDLRFVDRFGAAAVVLTFVNRETLNVDYYQPGGVVVDLGVVVRGE